MLKVISTLLIIITSVTLNLHYLTQNQGNKLKIIPLRINNILVDDKQLMIHISQPNENMGELERKDL